MRPTERPPQEVESLRDSDVADWLDKHERAALFFWDESDAVCQRQRARLEVVAASAGRPVGILDVRHDPLVAHSLGVTGVPLLVVFRGGAVVERLIGAVPEAILQGALAGGPHHER